MAQDDLRALYDEAVRQCNQQVNTITELEAARDHLRARLQQLIPYAQHKAGCESVSHRRSDDGGVTFAWPAKDCTCGLADRLAVLTEPPQQSIRENGPINAIGPALDTKGEMP